MLTTVKPKDIPAQIAAHLILKSQRYFPSAFFNLIRFVIKKMHVANMVIKRGEKKLTINIILNIAPNVTDEGRGGVLPRPSQADCYVLVNAPHALHLTPY